nr:acyl-CoA/acyl-ACP dehydrogenase [Saprospiraceae bacterium]
MNFDYTDQQQELIREIADFTQNKINLLDFIESEIPFNRSEWKVCGEIALHALPIPKEYGGRGLDAITTAVGLEELGYRCKDGGLPFAIAAQMLSCLVPIWKYGSNKQKKELLPPLSKGELLMANSITEADAGSDVYNLSSTAVEKENHYLLNGEKTMITNAPIADLSLVYMATDTQKKYFGGISAFLVNHGQPGVSSTEVLEKMGLESVQMGRQKYENVKINKDEILGKSGSGGPVFQSSMEWERACLSAVHVGMMRKILDFTVNFVKSRRVGDRYIGKYQAIAHKIADMEVATHACRMMLYEAAWKLDHKKRPGLSASRSKLFISEAFQKLCYDAFSIMGGSGYLKGSFIESYLRDSLSATVYSGTSNIQKNIIASYLKI